MKGGLPPLDWQEIFVRPWLENGDASFWTVLMGFFVAAGCGLIGNYLLLRRLALLGDAMSHSILPGLVAAFALFQSRATGVMFAGALVAAAATVVLIEFIQRQSRLKPDAAICITFTTLFALGVALLSHLETHGGIHLDAECVLYGEIAFVPLEPRVVWMGIEWGPPSVLRMGLIFAALAVAVGIFYKELLITSFDPGMASAAGINPAAWHYGLLGALAVAVVSAFEAVGAILVVAMLVIPPMFAAQLSDRLPIRFLLTVAHAALSSVLGFHLSLWLVCSTAGAMALAAAGLFALAWGWDVSRKIFSLAMSAERK